MTTITNTAPPAKYMKHNGNYYKLIDLDTCDKQELIDMIRDAKEMQPNIIVKEVPKYIDNNPLINRRPNTAIQGGLQL